MELLPPFLKSRRTAVCRAAVAVGALAFLLAAPARSSAVIVVLRHLNRGNDGRYPSGTPIVSGGFVYGTCASGGMGKKGTVYKAATDGSSYTVLHSFDGTDGGRPHARLTRKGQTLYGVCNSGGTGGGYGTIFKVKTDGTGFAVLHHFNGTLGALPFGKLHYAVIDNVKYLLGTTFGGGTGGTGCVFRIKTNGTGYTVLGSFDADPALKGAHPHGGVVRIGTKLYGFATSGGANGFGTIYRLKDTGGAITVLRHLAYADGVNPYYGGPATDGTFLYGTGYYGGAAGYGAVFKIKKDGTGFVVLHNFTGAATDGYYPFDEVTLVGSTLYGTTVFGGPAGLGNIYKLMTDGTGFAQVDNLSNASTEGAHLYAGVAVDGGVVYGAAGSNGMNGYGTVFKATP